MLEAEQREIDEMRSLMDAGNHSGALSIYQGRYKRFARNPPPPRQVRVWLCVCLSLPSVCLPVCLPVCLSVCLSVCVRVC